MGRSHPSSLGGIVVHVVHLLHALLRSDITVVEAS